MRSGKRTPAAGQASAVKPRIPVPPSARRTPAGTFLRRSVRLLERLTAAASPEVLESALSAPTDIGGVASLLSDMAAFDIDLSKVDPLAEAMARGAERKQELLRNTGGGLSSTQVAKALGLTRQAVDKRRSRGMLLAVPDGSGNYVYPACQFGRGGVRGGVAEALQAFGIRDPWMQLSVLIEPAPGLGGKTVLQALEHGDRRKALGIVSAFGDQ